LPDYFDATFQADVRSFVSAVAAHLAASPYKNSLEYVRIGLGEAGEGYPCIGCSSGDLHTLQNWGYSIATWAAWQKSMLISYQAAFPSVPVIYPLGDSDMDPTNTETVQQEVGYWAAANGFGVGQQGLVDTTGYANSQIVKICQYIRQHYPAAYIQFQTVSVLSCLSQLQGDTAIANTAGAFSIEWYNSDSILSGYQPAFAAWQSMVDARTAHAAGSGDCDGDSHVSVTDLSILLSHFNSAYQPCDFNAGGMVTIFDLSILLSNYGV